MTKREFIIRLYEIGAVKFGEFTLKSGVKSPFYLDLRDIISDNELSNAIADMLAEMSGDLAFDYVTGIPYTALPIATLVAQKIDKPLIYSRKETKSYGTKNAIIGQYQKGGKCLVIDDLITSGESIMETAEKYQEEGLITKDFMVVIDRSRGGVEYLKSKGYNLHSLIHLDEIVETLFKEKMISQKQVEDIELFMDSLGEKEEKEIVFNSQIEKIQELIKKKNSRLMYTVEAQTQAEFFEHLKLVAEKAIIIKTNVNYIYDMSADFVQELVSYIKKYDFLILEDRHFVNPSPILKGLYLSGNVWSDFVSMHALTGTDVIQNLFEGKDGRSAFLYAKLSTNGNLMNDNYMRQVFETGSKFPNRVSGYFCEASSKEELQRMRNKIAPYQLMVATVNENMSEEEALAGGADLLLI